ncbi:MAG: hypothetical protein HY319_24010 [Armatimonadetes bacterium]|nr:hypothetical protein [Armatimonadota bacterium]
MTGTSILQRVWNPLQEALASWFPVAVEEPVAPVEEEIYQLDRILQIYARRRIGADTFRLLTEKMGPGSLLFKTGEPVEAGATLEVQLLLRSDLFLTLAGTVTWVQSSDSGCSGELELNAAPEHRDDIGSYLRQHGKLIYGGELSNKNTIAQPRQRAQKMVPCRCPECGQIVLEPRAARKAQEGPQRPVRYKL